jgi:hypothetical protein
MLLRGSKLFVDAVGLLTMIFGLAAPVIWASEPDPPAAWRLPVPHRRCHGRTVPA